MPAPYFYTRWSNPTVALLEARLAALEGGAAAVCYASGMAAVAALFFSRLKAGDQLILSDVCYAGVAELACGTLPRLGIAATPVDTSNPEAVARAVRPGVTRLLHVETPANPTLRLGDIAALAAIAHEAGADLSVDSTHRHASLHSAHRARGGLCCPFVDQIHLRARRCARRRDCSARSSAPPRAAPGPGAPGRCAAPVRCVADRTRAGNVARAHARP